VAIRSRPNWGMTYTMDTNTPGQVKLDVTNGTTLTAYQQWQFKYFNCTNSNNNCPQAATNYDADGTGQNNLFKFEAGLDPTNPASIFVVQIAGVTNPPGQKIISYTPIATGRTYTVQFSANMVGAAYTNLTTFTGPVTNNAATQASVTDTNATQSAKFYRVQISMP
jgi:hypothetical protein